jgi:hypothetical protein
MKPFKSAGQAQRFLYRTARAFAFQTWAEITGVAGMA